jgi:hypothetical protein
MMVDVKLVLVIKYLELMQAPPRDYARGIMLEIHF